MREWFLAEVRRAPTLYAVLLVALVSVAAYANSLDAGFHYDDSHHIVDNPNLRDTNRIPAYFTRPDMFSGNPNMRMYRPVLLTTYALNYSWGGYRPLLWRLTALALHASGAVGVLLLFSRLARSMCPGGSAPVQAGALVAALLFALHPVFSETVDYASARSSLLATALLVWALYLGIVAEEAPRSGLRLLGWAASLLLFGAALLSKSIAVVYPVLLAAVALLRGRGWKGVVAALAVTLLYLAARHILLGQAVIDFRARPVEGADPYHGGKRPIPWNLYTQARVLLAYLALLVHPLGLTVDHYVRVSRTPWEPGVLAGFATAGILLVLAWRGRRARPLVALGTVWFLVGLAPTSSVVPLNVLMNEHRLYLPGVGFALAAGAALAPLWYRGGRAVRLAFPAVALLLLALTLRRNEDWRDPVRLWEAAVEVSPESYGAWNNLGVQRNRRHGDYEGSREALERAAAINPRAWEVAFNLGMLCLEHGRALGDAAMLADAEAWTRRSLEIEPTSYRSRWCVAEVRLAQGHRDEARAEFARMAAESPFLHRLSRYVFARLALEDGDLAAAEGYYREALALEADPIDARLGLAEVARRADRSAEAEQLARTAAKERPHDPRPYLFLARMYRGARAVASLFEAERRGYRPTPSERRAILGTS